MDWFKKIEDCLEDCKEYDKKYERLSFDSDNKNTQAIISKCADVLLKIENSNIDAKQEIKETLLEGLIEIASCIDYKTRAVKAEQERDAYKVVFEEFKAAWKEYNSKDHTRWDQRAKAYFNKLGLTTGKRQEKTDKRFMFYEYMELTHGSWDTETFKKTEAVSKQDALKILADKYELASTDACLEQLMTYVRRMNKKFKAEGTKDYSFEKILPGKNPYKK